MNFLVTADLAVADGDGTFVTRDGALFFRGAVEMTTKGGIGVSSSVVYNLFLLACKSHSLFPAYEKHGRVVVRSVDGVFSCVFYDGKFLFVCRDTYGVEPLFWGETDGGLWLSSTPWRTPWHHFPPGHFALVDMHNEKATNFTSIATCRWSEDTFHGHLRAAPNYHKLLITNYLRDAVAKITRQHTDAVYLLSGGVCSTILAYVGMELKKKSNGGGGTITTCAIGFEDSPDLLAAAVVAKHLGSEHIELQLQYDDVTTEVVAQVTRQLRDAGGDAIATAIPYHMASMELRARGHTALISGEGGQAIWGGYADSDEAFFLQKTRTLYGVYRRELRQSVHVHRMTGIRCHVPFLETNMVEVSMNMHGNFKRPADGDKPDKPALRYAFADVLPPDLLTRPHVPFDHGVGSSWREYLDLKAQAEGFLDATTWFAHI